MPASFFGAYLVFRMLGSLPDDPEPEEPAEGAQQRRVKRLYDEVMTQGFFYAALLTFVVVSPTIGYLATIQQCADYADGYYLSSDPSQSCASPKYVFLAQWARIAGFLYFGINIVAATLLYLRISSVLSSLQFLWDGYDVVEEEEVPEVRSRPNRGGGPQLFFPS